MMNKKTLKNDKRAVSPVIGVILMVAITVILAAVIAAFVFGIAPPSAKANPAYSLNRANASHVTITLHDMGGATDVKDHYVSTDGGSPKAIAGITAVGNTSTFAAAGPAHIVITATVDGKNQVVIDTTL